eukprot:g1866.t1
MLFLLIFTLSLLFCNAQDISNNSLRARQDDFDNAVMAEFREADSDNSFSLDLSEFTDFRFKQLNSQRKFAESFIDFHDKVLKDKGIPVQFRDVVGKTERKTLSFWAAFVNSVAMIIATEIGDKTFFIAAIMAMRHKRIWIFTGAVGALAVMTILSSAVGFVLPNLLPRKYTHLASAALFVYFGYKMLSEAYDMTLKGEGDEAGEELEEAEAELNHGSPKHKASCDSDLSPLATIESGREGMERNQSTAYATSKSGKRRRKMYKVVAQAFTLTFLAEWGDRSQIATIALAAAKDPFGVTAGGIIGHSLCTGLAVVGGRALASRISERQVAYFGGTLFILFAVVSVIAGPS